MADTGYRPRKNLLEGTQGGTLMREYRNWREFLVEELAGREAALDYLQITLEEYQIDGDTSFFLQEIQTVVKAQGGIEEVAKRTAIAPETLSKILASNEAPYLDTFATILKALGCRLSIELIEAEDCGAVRAGVDTSVSPIEDIKSEMVLSSDNK